MGKTIKALLSMMEGAKISGADDKEILTIEHDSRKVKEGTLFAALVGATVDGHAFISQAVAQGAAAVLVEKEVVVPEGVTVIQVPDVKKAIRGNGAVLL